jgi:hypothetical protein
VRVDQRLPEGRVRRQREPREEIAEALGSCDLTVIDGSLALGFLPARQQRVVTGRQRDGRRVDAEQLVQAAGRRADDLAAHLDGRQPLAVEVDERVEEVEEDGGVSTAQSGLRFA